MFDKIIASMSIGNNLAICIVDCGVDKPAINHNYRGGYDAVLLAYSDDLSKCHYHMVHNNAKGQCYVILAGKRVYLDNFITAYGTNFV